MLHARQTRPVSRIAPVISIRDAKGTAIVVFRDCYLAWQVDIRLLLIWVVIRKISLLRKAFGAALVGCKSKKQTVLAGRSNVTRDLVHEARFAWP
jgi:hypothetical protein